MLEAAAPIGTVRASWRAVDAWLTVLGNLEALRFLPRPAPTNSGPVVKLVLVPLDSKLPRAVLEIGARCPKGPGRLLIRREPDLVAACVNASLVKKLLVDAAQFVDEHVIGTVESDVVELRLSDERGIVEIARKGKGWRMRKPDEAALDSVAADALLGRLVRLEGQRISAEQAADLGALGLDPPRAKVRLIGLPERSVGPKAEDRVEKVDVGAVVDGKRYVKRLDDGVVMALAEDQATALLPAPSVLRANSIFAARREHVTGLQLDCGGKRQKLTRDLAGAWTLIEPKSSGLRADLGQANELADALRSLAAIRWVAEEPNAAHGLSAPWCTLQLDVLERKDEEEIPRQLKVRLGSAAAGGYYAQHEDHRAVFVAPKALARMARVWLLDRAALLPSVADVDRVEVTDEASKRKLVVVRRGDKWLLSSGDPRDRRAAAVGKAIEQLVAEGVVRLGPQAKADGLDAPRARITIRLRSKPAEPMEIAVGAAELWQEVPVRFVRAKGLEATFAVARARIKPILDAL